METKKCNKCGVEKAVAEFSKNRNAKDGLQRTCKSCEAEYRKKNAEKIAEYRKKNAEKIAAKEAEYRKKNAEKIAAREAEYRKKNAEKLAEYFAEYRKKNAEKIAARNAEYRKKNPEYLAEYRKKNAEKIAAREAEYRKKNAEKIAAKDANYRKSPSGKLSTSKCRVSREIRKKACALANTYAEEIKRIYQLAADTKELAGTEIHVDHICPLKAKVYDPDFDCYLPATGLHVPWNLEPVPAGQNLRKLNSVHLDEVIFSKR